MSSQLKTVVSVFATLVVFAAVLAACSPASAASIPAQKRLITMSAVEWKGGVTVDKEPFPKDALPTGDGYILKAPDNTGRWEVSTYRWDPNQVVVNQGDEVTLEIVGINGSNHPATIEGYNVGFAIKRGAVTRVTFKADKAGVFKITCGTHLPSMVGELIVMPRS